VCFDVYIDVEVDRFFAVKFMTLQNTFRSIQVEKQKFVVQ